MSLGSENKIVTKTVPRAQLMVYVPEYMPQYGVAETETAQMLMESTFKAATNIVWLITR